MYFEAIIFDCDGTLVDSEVLGNQVLVECVAELGLAIPLEEALARFTGARMADSIAYIEQRLGRSVPSGFVAGMRERMGAVFQERLQPVAGVEAVLQALQVPLCVASNGPGEKMAVSLRTTGLLPYFGGRIFSAYEVGSWKPAPGLFLYAAEAMGIAPERCAVVEDSILGVEAGIAAGMQVFAYAPAGGNPAMAAAGASLFERMEALLPLLRRGC
jgi:HAD superfamily hydrolase (TIGR01509 family)